MTILGHGGSTSGFSALMFFVPTHRLGGVVLTNAWGAFAFTAAVRARLLELLFDGREEAARRLAYGLAQRAETRARARGRTDTAPPVATLRPFLGSYENASLGRITLRAEGTRVVLDAAHWRSAVGRKREPDGTTKLVLLDPPWTHFEFIADSSGGRSRLIVERPQARYVFAPVAAAAAPAD